MALQQKQSKTPLVTTSEHIHKRVAVTKQRVCEVAAAAFNAEGYGNVSIETILREADIARSTFYRFFRDKEDLLVHIIDPMFVQAKQELDGIDPDAPEMIVNGIAQCYLSLWNTQGQALILSSNIGNALFPLVQETHDDFAHAIYGLMRKIDDVRMLRNDDAHLSAVLLAQTAVKMLPICERHPYFENAFISALRGMLLKW